MVLPQKENRLGSRILGNILALGAGQLVTLFCGVISAVVLARALGPAVYGILGFGAAFISYFGLLVNMGMDVHGIREISRKPLHGPRLVTLVVLMRLILAIILFSVFWITSREQTKK